MRQINGSEVSDYPFFFSYIILNPLIIVIFNCVLPLLATAYLKTGILERLADANAAMEYFAQHGMFEAEVGTAGVVRVTSTPIR